MTERISLSLSMAENWRENNKMINICAYLPPFRVRNFNMPLVNLNLCSSCLFHLPNRHYSYLFGLFAHKVPPCSSKELEHFKARVHPIKIPIEYEWKEKIYTDKHANRQSRPKSNLSSLSWLSEFRGKIKEEYNHSVLILEKEKVISQVL